MRRGEGPVLEDLATYRKFAVLEDPSGVMRAETLRLGANP
jgi:7,8-dihydropterin-6-yl-methyl-4-(beta-D-ribofuranosyl)aminobenzene 5'-phosphate synthase